MPLFGKRKTPEGPMTTTRRHFIQTSAALAGASALGIGAATAKPLPFRYAFSAISWETDIESAVKTGEKLGFPGIEPFRHNIVNYLGRPLALKKFMDDHHIRMATCSNGGGPDFSGNFYDPAMADKTVADHIKFVREFIVPFGYCNHFKMNMGPRPKNYDTTDEMVKRCADTLNRIGREILKDGIKLAPHPHVNSLVQNQHEVDLLMKETDPAHVWMTADLAHLTLGGIVPMELLTTYWPRIAEVHYKDAPRKLRGGRVVAVPRTGPEAGGHNWFRAMTDPDAGGVDFPRVQKFLIDKQYDGWVTLDYDASMMEHSHKTMEELLAADKKYMIDVLKVDPKENFHGA
jgi:sugar phosphate isomerase/epimerase